MAERSRNRRSARLLSITALAAALLAAGCAPRRHGPGPLSPEAARASLLVRDGFRVELFAAEPLVTDPVEIAFDERGRAYVAEMLDYPSDPPPGQPPRSRIRLLEDRDGDGRADTSVVFADRLLQVTSVLPWSGGVIVTSAPDILFLKDTDGDGRADVRRVLFTGFSSRANSEGRVTNLRFNVDNWIYASNDGAQGTVTSPEHPGAPAVSVLGADFRFRLDRGLFEAESGPTRFGQGFDDWGHRFITTAGWHARHVVLPRRYLDRNPFLALTEAAENASDHGARIFQISEPQFWRQARTEMRQRRFQELAVDQREIAGGVFTGGAGGTIYGGDTFPPEYRGNVFTGDVACNLVHRDVLEPRGATFVARRAAGETDREFLASTDPWFRPCNLTTGPDGNLYVVDMYREVIEAPESIPVELKKDIDFYSGSDRGRIWRVVPSSAPPARAPRPDLGRAPTAELVGLLGHANSWWRFTAQRLLVERQDRAAVPLLARLASEGATGQARLHALYGLEALGALDAAAVGRALKDPVAGVREQALVLAERFPELAGEASKLALDPAPRVVFQAALSLGNLPGDPLPALAAVARKHAEDRWFRAALLTSRAGSSSELLAAAGAGLVAGGASSGEALVAELAAVVGARSDGRELARFLKLVASAGPLAGPGPRAAALEGLARGLETAGARHLRVEGADPLLGRLLAGGPERVEAATLSAARFFDLPSLFAASRRVALDPREPAPRRRRATLALAAGRFSDARPVLEALLDGRAGSEVAEAAIDVLGWFDDASVPAIVLARWKTFGPEARNRALDALLRRRAFVPELLGAIEKGAIEPTALDLPRREKLLRNPDDGIRGRAAKAFPEQSTDRERVVAGYRPSLELAGDPGRGRALFDKNCATCHLARAGRTVGPDLARVQGRSKLELLESILDPSRAIESGFTNYVILTRDGQMHDGLIAGDTGGIVTLRRGNEDETILRSEITEIRASSISLMPDGFEATLGPREIADVIAFLQGTNLREAAARGAR